MVSPQYWHDSCASRLGGVASGVKFKEAQVVLLLTDNETTEQLAAATGAARATDLGVGGIVIGKVLAVPPDGDYQRRQVIAAAFLDAHNKLVVQARALGPTGAAAVGGGSGKSSVHRRASGSRCWQQEVAVVMGRRDGWLLADGMTRSQTSPRFCMTSA